MPPLISFDIILSKLLFYVDEQIFTSNTKKSAAYREVGKIGSLCNKKATNY